MAIDNPSPLIQCNNITIRFSGRMMIEDLSFTVFPRDKVLLYGQSGIGKTTIFRMLLGFERIQEGSITFDGKPVDEHSVWDIRKKISYVSQDTDIGAGPVHALLHSFFSYKSTKDHRPSKTRIHELLDFFRLPKTVLHEDYEQLSGGEKQRIELMIAILLERKIFLLDEATSALDREIKEEVIDHFLGNREWTVLSITHDQDWLEHKELIVIKVGE